MLRDSKGNIVLLQNNKYVSMDDQLDIEKIRIDLNHVDDPYV